MPLVVGVFVLKIGFESIEECGDVVPLTEKYEETEGAAEEETEGNADAETEGNADAETEGNGEPETEGNAEAEAEPVTISDSATTDPRYARKPIISFIYETRSNKQPVFIGIVEIYFYLMIRAHRHRVSVGNLFKIRYIIII